MKNENIIVWDVPGSFELIYGSKKAQKNNPNAVIAIGSIIKGETKHFEYVCQAVAHGIKDLNINSDVPVIFCVLTDSNIEQAKARSGGKHGNKGNEAAIAALKMAELNRNAKNKIYYNIKQILISIYVKFESCSNQTYLNFEKIEDIIILQDILMERK